MPTFPPPPGAGPGRGRSPGGPLIGGGGPAPVVLGPRSVSNTVEQGPGLGAVNPSMTLDALMARQKELAGRQVEVPMMQSPWQGVAHMANEFMAGMEKGTVQREEQASRQRLSEIVSGLDMSTGINQAQLGEVMKISPDLGLQLYEQAVKLQQDKAKAAADAGPKESDVNSMADDFSNVPDVKKFQNASSMWNTMQDAATRDTAQADLNMIIAAAKLFDPDSVVRTEEGEMVQDTGGLPSGLYAQFLKLTGTPGARLDRSTRIGILQEGFSRMNGYYKGVQEAAGWFREKAARRGYNPDDIVRPFAAPTPFDEKTVLGSDTAAEPAEPEKTDADPPPTEPNDADVTFDPKTGSPIFPKNWTGDQMRDWAKRQREKAEAG